MRVCHVRTVASALMESMATCVFVDQDGLDLTVKQVRMILSHRYRRDIPDLVYHPINVKQWGSNWGVLGVLLTTYAKTNPKQMHPWFLHTMRRFTHVYPPAQTAADAGDYTPDEPRTWGTTVILITGKRKDSNLSPMQG